jgi:hypothetical protein
MAILLRIYERILLLRLWLRSTASKTPKNTQKIQQTLAQLSQIDSNISKHFPDFPIIFDQQIKGLIQAAKYCDLKYPKYF